ncbi:MAG: TRAP transporter substrate-binding protein [Lachnospiraceae bacterium]|nr:TRAP transporter substrate-binding protein [Lachnospiraceae bacterium]
MKRTKSKSRLLCLGLCLVLTGCGTAGEVSPAETSSAAETSETAEETVYLSVATSGNWENIIRGELFEEYTEKLSAWSDGEIVMKIYYDGELGTDLELIAGVQEGTLCIVNLVPTYQTSAVPEAALLDIPGLFETTEEFNYFIDNYYMDSLQEYYQAAGIRLLTCSAFSFRQLTSNQEVTSLTDLKGLKLRTMESEYQIAFWQSMGATVIPLSFTEVRLAIQQGILDAQENPLGYMITTNLIGVQDYVILTNHLPMISTYLMNEEQYQALSEEDRELLQRFMDEMSQELVEQEPAEEDEILEELTAQGVQISEASKDIREGIQAGKEVVIGMLREDLGAEVVDDYLEQVAEAKEAYAAENEIE